MDAKVREEFERAFEEEFGWTFKSMEKYSIDFPTRASFWAARWALNQLTLSGCGSPCSDNDLISIGFIRKRLKELS